MYFHGERLRQIREAKGWTKVALAKKLNISDPQIGRWESGKTAPRLSIIRKLCRVLGVPVDELANYDGNPVQKEAVTA
jgi:transcriptional regulator with XRE-family HTH domain